eukprot:SAG11_NODE_32_length_22830_cov_17.507941_11_plen_161_part_00
MGLLFPQVNVLDSPTRFRVVPVAKRTDIVDSENNGFVCGGDYCSLYQRQTNTYLHRDTEGQAVLLQMDAKADQEDTTPTARTDVLWHLNLPAMKWSGVHITEGVVVSLKDAVSATFLTENNDGTLGFEETDDDLSSRWILHAFEDDVDKLIVEKTYFFLE